MQNCGGAGAGHVGVGVVGAGVDHVGEGADVQMCRVRCSSEGQRLREAEVKEVQVQRCRGAEVKR